MEMLPGFVESITPRKPHKYPGFVTVFDPLNVSEGLSKAPGKAAIDPAVGVGIAEIISYTA